MAQQTAGAGANKVRVLVADDSRVIRKAVAKILGEDFEILEAEDGEDGWQLLARDERIEVLITDIMMPRLDGYGFICRVRASETSRIRDIPIIVITGAQDETTRERAYACGATDFIVKPIDAVQMLARARAHAKLDQTTRKLTETEHALGEQSAVDPLTQLHSRRYFVEHGAQDVAFAGRHEHELSVIRLDIDQFPDVPPHHGEATGNKILVWTANILLQACRTEDTVARLVDSEFAIIAPATGRVEAAVLCERIRSAVAKKPFVDTGININLTVSLGLASLGRDGGDSIDALLGAAGRHLALARAAGGNRLGVGYQEEIAAPEESVMEQPDLETALKLLENGDGGKLIPYLPDLMLRVAPLLDFAARNLDLDFGYDIESLKEKFSSAK
jgi:diguanylate cyclase (GGDEF)-like protein